VSPGSAAGALRFGVDGWRGTIDVEFTWERVASVTGAIALYLQDRGLAARGVVVAHDCRQHSQEYAADVASLLVNLGIPAFLGSGPMPTPVAAFAVCQKRAAGALMFTASHNPPDYNGIKFIPDYGGPAPAAVTDAIQCRANAQGPARRVPKTAAGPATISRFDPSEDYLARVRGLLDLDGWRDHPTIVVDVMHGAGGDYLKRLLSPAGCRVELLHADPDPGFGGCSPDPTERNLEALKGRVQETGATLGAGLDGDGDRLALVDAAGRYYDANRILPLLYRYLLEGRGWRGGVARSLVTTRMLDRIARKYGQQVYQTPVGFKHIGPLLAIGEAILGGEESGGMSVCGHVPEKDGILGAALAVEMVAKWGKDLATIEREVHRDLGPLVSRRHDCPCLPDKRDAMIGQLGGQWGSIAGRSPAGVNHDDGFQATFADDSWCAARLSGTGQPLLRLYGEAADAGAVDALIKDMARRLGLQPPPPHPGTS
jgi:phosphomannomutase